MGSCLDTTHMDMEAMWNIRNSNIVLANSGWYAWEKSCGRIRPGSTSYSHVDPHRNIPESNETQMKPRNDTFTSSRWGSGIDIKCISKSTLPLSYQIFCSRSLSASWCHCPASVTIQIRTVPLIFCPHCQCIVHLPSTLCGILARAAPHAESTNLVMIMTI